MLAVSHLRIKWVKVCPAEIVILVFIEGQFKAFLLTKLPFSEYLYVIRLTLFQVSSCVYVPLQHSVSVMLSSNIIKQHGLTSMSKVFNTGNLVSSNVAMSQWNVVTNCTPRTGHRHIAIL